MTENEVRAVCAREGLKITEGRSIRIRGRGIDLHVAALSYVQPSDLEPTKRSKGISARVPREFGPK